MSLTRFELKKILKRPVVVIAFVAVMGCNLIVFFFGGGNYQYKVYNPFIDDIPRLQEEGAYFAGEMNEEWYDKYSREVNDIRNDPVNHVSAEEKEEIKQGLMEQGWSEKGIEQLGILPYLKEEVLLSFEYNKYEEMEVAAKFYDGARETGQLLGAHYREQYPGVKGETLAAKAEEMYAYIADEYTAYYNYDWGYWKLRNMHATYPLTIGLFILITLSPLFAAEYSGRMDTLILVSKHGKRKLIYAKLKAGLLVAFFSWLCIELSNVLFVIATYGTTGAEAYWQNWSSDWGPFAFNQWQITAVTIATSLLGVIFLASVVMLVSAWSNQTFISLLIGGAILLFPLLVSMMIEHDFLTRLINLMPTSVLNGINGWQQFGAVYIFGQVILFQYVMLATAVGIILCSLPVCFYVFKHHQVGN